MTQQKKSQLDYDPTTTLEPTPEKESDDNRGSFTLTPEDEQFVKDVYPELSSTLFPHFVGKKGSSPETTSAELSNKAEQILKSDNLTRNWASETKDPVMVKHVIIMMLQKDFANKNAKQASKQKISNSLIKLADRIDTMDSSLADEVDKLIK